MSEGTLDLKKLEEAGEALGRAYAAMLKGFIRGYKEATKAEEAVTDPDKAKETQEDETPKDCCNCWCDECAELDECVVEKEGFSNESRPMPCDGCNKGMRFMPKENPPCEKFRAGENGFNVKQE